MTYKIGHKYLVQFPRSDMKIEVELLSVELLRGGMGYLVTPVKGEGMMYVRTLIEE